MWVIHNCLAHGSCSPTWPDIAEMGLLAAAPFLVLVCLCLLLGGGPSGRWR